MSTSPTSKDETKRLTPQARVACRGYVESAAALLIVGLLAAATWRPVVIGIMVNALVSGWRLTGNLGASIILLGVLFNGAMFLLKAPQRRAEQSRLAMNRSGVNLKGASRARPSATAGGAGGIALSGIRNGLPIVFIVALFWFFWKVLPPPGSNSSAGLEPYLWRCSDASVLSLGTGFANLDLRVPDRIERTWSPVPLPGVLVLLSSAMQVAYQAAKAWARRRFGLSLFSVPARILIYSGGAVLGMVIGVLVPAGVVLHWLATTPFTFLDLVLFPLAALHE